MAELQFRVDIDGNGFAKVKKLAKSFKEADKETQRYNKSFRDMERFTARYKETVKDTSNNFDTFTNKITAFVGAGVFLKLGKDAIMARAGLEDLELQFKPLLGSAEDAQKRIKELSQFASRTPFQLPEIAKASKVLETLTGGLLSTGKGLEMVGDSASVAGVSFDELAVHIGRAYSNLQANRGAGESLARLQELGLVSGETRNQIEELQKSARGQEAWKVLRGELDKTEGAMKGLSSTFTGKLSTLQDNFTNFMAVLAEESGTFDILKKGIDEVTESIQWWTELIEEPPKQTPIMELAKQTNIESKKTLAIQKQIDDENKRQSGPREWRIKKLKERLELQKESEVAINKELASLQRAHTKKVRMQAEEAERERKRKKKQEAPKVEPAKAPEKDTSEIDAFVKAEMDKAQALMELKMSLKQGERERNLDEFELARQDEIADNLKKMELLKEFHESTEQQEKNTLPKDASNCRQGRSPHKTNRGS